jgi:hypothetical protein
MIPIRILKIAVIVMGLLIVAGLVAIGIKIVNKSQEAAESLSVEAVESPAPPVSVPVTSTGARFDVSIDQLDLGPGAQLISMDVDNGRLVLRVRGGDAGERVLIVDIGSGAVLGEVALPPALQ